ncbi:MAG: hypothetical protein ACE145_06895 [Terriglobia bacterium]
MAASKKEQEAKAEAAEGKESSDPGLESGAVSVVNRPAHREVTNEHSGVPTKHAAPIAGIGIKVSDDLRPLDIGDEAEIVQLQSDWPGLSALHRGLRLRELIDAGNSRRALAKALGCSEGLVRQLLRLTSLTGDEKQSMQEGELSCRQALKITGVRRVRARQERLASDQQERAKHIDVLVAAALEWIQPLGLSASYSEQFIDELRWGPYGARRWDMRREAPELWQIPVGKDPKDIIRSTRPDGPVPAYGPDRMNYNFTWYARWSQRLMPDVDLRDAVMQRVSQKFR